jgi:DNA-binding protein H-NS
MSFRVLSVSRLFSKKYTMAKTKTFADLTKEIDALKAKAEAVRKHEAAGVIARIKSAIDAYGLTAADLGLGGAKPGTPKVASAKSVTAKSPHSPTTQVKPKLPAKYRDSAGNSWTGRGSKPKWLTAALASGQSLANLAVGTAGPDEATAAGVTISPQAARSTPKAKAKAKLESAAKYQDAQGNRWGGRGPKPGWVKAALAAGRTLEQLAA